MLYGYRQLYSYPKTEDIYTDISKDVEPRFDTSSYELERPLPKPKNKNVIGLMKDKFTALRVKTYSYFTDNNDKNKKSKRHKKVCHEKKN